MSGSWSHSAATHLTIVAGRIYADIFLCPYVCLSVCVCMRGIKNIFIVIKRTFFYYYYSPLFLILTTQITQMYLADTFYFLHPRHCRCRCRVLFSAHILFIDRDKRHEANFKRTTNDIPAIPHPRDPLPSLATCELYLFAVLLVSAFLHSLLACELFPWVQLAHRFLNSCLVRGSQLSLQLWLRFPQLTHNQGTSSCHMPLSQQKPPYLASVFKTLWEKNCRLRLRALSSSSSLAVTFATCAS